MQAPFQPRIKDPTKAWEVNEDPAKVDAMYVKMLGRGGDKVLTDDIKWLAITHKSFDQGRRGFNDRLAFFGRPSAYEVDLSITANCAGKRLLTLQANISLIHGASSGLPSTDNFDREPFSHPALEGLSNLENTEIGEIFSKDRMGQLARAYGIDQVTRWKPRIPKDLDASGCDVVYTTSLFAIVGAIALQRGGQMANEVARELVLKPLGI